MSFLLNESGRRNDVDALGKNAMLRMRPPKRHGRPGVAQRQTFPDIGYRTAAGLDLRLRTLQVGS